MTPWIVGGACVLAVVVVALLVIVRILALVDDALQSEDMTLEDIAKDGSSTAPLATPR